ncbi:MAG: sortase [Firmicutes bacterium]|nr:sortase [Bacillota bacterium]
MRQNKAGLALMMLGAALIASALLLFGWNRAEDENAGQQAAIMLQRVQETIPEKKMEPAKLTVTEIGGYEYIGYVSIPRLEVELPVMAGWDYDRLKIAPCRHFGSPESDDLVIAAHNYKNHFGRLARLKAEDVVLFSDMEGGSSTYAVRSVTRVEPTDMEAVQNSGYDLVLYTCAFSGDQRIIVGCERLAEDKTAPSGGDV